MNTYTMDLLRRNSARRNDAVLAHRTLYRVCMFFVIGMMACTWANGQDVELTLAGKKVTLKPQRDEVAVATEGADGAVVNALRVKGILSSDTVSVGTQGDSVGYTFYKLDNNAQKRRFQETVASYNANNINEAEITPVYEYESSLNILTEEFIISFKKEVSADTIAKFLAANSMEKISEDTLLDNQFIIRFRKLSSVQALQKLSKFDTKLVRYIEPNFVQVFKNSPFEGVSNRANAVTSPPTEGPNDSLLSSQWYIRNVNAQPDISMIDGWKISKGSPNIIVAILDEGVDTGHPDLRDKIVNAYDAVENDSNQEPQARAGHGTACAGIAAASTDNQEGIAGIAWNCKIMPVRIAEIDLQNKWITKPQIIVRGILRAVNRGARVLSCSWSGGPPSGPVADAIDYAISRNCILVFAAGNDNRGVNYPARWSLEKTIIAVSATNQLGESQTPTNVDGEQWGTNFGPQITVSAPGVHIFTTDISILGRGYVTDSPYYNDFAGTSASTPMVAGAIALMLSKNPSLTPAQVLGLLKQNCDAKGTTLPDHRFGYGRLNIAKLLNATPAQ